MKLSLKTSVLDFLVDVSVRFELLSDNADEKKFFLATMPEGIANNLCLYIAFLLINKYSS